jgi:hypothetical protein
MLLPLLPLLPQRFRNQVSHPVKASDSIGIFGLASYREQIRNAFLFLLLVAVLYNVIT